MITSSVPAKFNVDDVRAAYRRYAPIYDLAFGSVVQHGRRRLAELLSAEPGSSILEIGVGSGLMLPLYPRDATVVGVDISPEMLLRAKRRVVQLRLSGVELHCADFDKLTLSGRRFDHVVLPYVYSVVPDPKRLIEVARQFCTEQGSIWILNHFSEGRRWRAVEQRLAPFARQIGFRSNFCYAEHVTSQNWNIAHNERVNPFGLTRLIRFVG